MRSLHLFSAAALLCALVKAQNGVPTHKGPLLIEPGLSSAKCMTAESNSDGAPVIIDTCTGADSQKWTFTNGSISVFGSKCLDIPGGSTANGIKLQIWTCDSRHRYQGFYYNQWINQLSWTHRGKCVDLTGGKLNNGNRIQTWDCTSGSANQVWNMGYNANALPQTCENGQTGTNACGTTSSQTSECQTAWINNVDDFCLWAPPSPGTVGDTERIEVAWCTKSGRGTRTIPDGTLKGVHFVKTPDYVQVTGMGDFTKINIPKGDDGGELDPHGADGNGNPIGGLVFGNSFGPSLQYHEWTSFISDTQFCFRACVGPNAARNCQHTYDTMGCYWNMPASYDAGVFESCNGDDTEPMGIYGTSTWHQGVSPTPPAHQPGASSQCRTIPTVAVSPVRKSRRDGLARFARAEPTPA